MLCTPACQSDDDCEEGETCGGDGHCAATSCASDTDCPALFFCQDSDAAACARKSCTTDPDCGLGGWCVKNQCHSQPGFCTRRTLRHFRRILQVMRSCRNFSSPKSILSLAIRF